MISLLRMAITGVRFRCAFLGGSLAHQVRERTIILRTAIGIAGTILRYGADEDCCRADHFRPAHRRGEEMGVAKGYVGDGNLGWRVRWNRRIPGQLCVAIGKR